MMSSEATIREREVVLAGRKALALAQNIADHIAASDVPSDHWDEVLERLRELLSEQLADD